MQIDSDGYLVRIDSHFYGAIGANERLDIAPVDTGSHWLQLGGVASNCWITGASHIYLHLFSRRVTKENFDVQCEAPVPSSIRVVTYIMSLFAPPNASQTDSSFIVVLDDKVSHRMTSQGTLLFAGLTSGFHQVQLRPASTRCRYAFTFPPMAPLFRHVQVDPDGEAVVQFTAHCL